MSNPTHLKYTAEHEWLETTADTARVGVTAHAADALGDLVFVELPEVGSTVTAGEACGELESTKSVSDLFAPVSGVVTERNEQLDQTPELVNSDPYGEGWLIKVRIDDPAAVASLMDAASYRDLLGA